MSSDKPFPRVSAPTTPTAVSGGHRAGELPPDVVSIGVARSCDQRLSSLSRAWHELGADRDRLTDAERRVTELAAAGHTNAEIAGQLRLSVSTIETHPAARLQQARDLFPA